MSGNFEGSSSENPRDQMENFHITGWEIVPYVPALPLITAVKSSVCSSTIKVVSNKLTKDQEVQLDEISKILKRVVRQSVAELKLTSPAKGGKGITRGDEIIEAVPLSYHLPEDCDVRGAKMRLEMFVAEKSPSQPSNTTRRRNATSLTGEIFVSFQLPDDFPSYGEELIDKELPLIAQSHRRYTLSKRLKDWKVQRKQRIEGRHDMYYYHLESNAQFRSLREVVDFLTKEEFPDKQRMAQKLNTAAPVEGSAERKRTRSGPRMKKHPVHPISQSSGSKAKESTSTRTPTSDSNVSRNDNVRETGIQYRILAEEVLAQAHNNLHNFPSFAPRSSDTRDKKDVEGFSRPANNEVPASSKNKVTSRGIKKRKRTSENMKREDDQEMVEAIIGGDTTEVELGKLERGQKVKAEPIEKIPDPAKTKETSANILPGDQVAIANDRNKAQVNNIAAEVKGESAAKAVQAGNTGVHYGGDDLVVLSSFSEQCDLINHIPMAEIADDEFIAK